MPATTPPVESSAARNLRRQVDRIARIQELDVVASKLDGLVRPLFKSPRVRRILSGVPIGHRLHPLLTDVTIGSFLGATLVDLMAPRHSEISRRLIGVGIVAALPTAASGLSDWLDVYDGGRRIGLVHAAGNSVALVLFTRSFMQRGAIHRMRHGRGHGRLTLLFGMAVTGMTGYLGGHLSYVLGVGVDHTAFEASVSEWTDVAGIDELGEGSHKVVTAGEVEILLVRQGGEIYALSNRCSHAGWPLDPGEFEGGCVTCPQHGSSFHVADGAVMTGPAASPQPIFDVRVADGRIAVRSLGA